MTPRHRRLLADLQHMRDLTERDATVSFQADGAPPETYRVMLGTLGLARHDDGAIVLRTVHRFSVYLHLDYPRRPPQFLWMTPIWHPNLLPPDRNGGVCIGAWSASESLADLVVRVRDMVSYQSFNADDALDTQAAAWVRAMGITPGARLAEYSGVAAAALDDGAGVVFGAKTLVMPPTGEIPGLRAVAETEIYPHCFERTDREVGGVLVGRSTPHGPTVVGAIRAVHAGETLANLTFTQESWAYMHRIRDEEYPDCTIVGWYHSHPGHGIFLSEQDLFIHRHFFADPNQVAYVVDPVEAQEGVFGWRDGEIVRLLKRSTAHRPAHSRSSARSRASDPDFVTGATAERRMASRHLPLDVVLYLAVIALALGVCFWALVLR